MTPKTWQTSSLLGTAFLMLSGAAVLAAAHARELLARPAGACFLLLWALWSLAIFTAWPYSLTALRAGGRGGLWYGAGLGILGLLAVGGAWEYTHYNGPLPRDGSLVGAGALVFGAGLAVQAAALRELGGVPAGRQNPRWLRTGIYAHLRYPLLTAAWLNVLGMALVLATLSALAAALLALAWLAVRIRHEEARVPPVRWRARWRLLPGIY